MTMKNDFQIKGWAPTFVLKQRPAGTRKWPIWNPCHPPPLPPNHGVDVRLSNQKLAIETGCYSKPFEKPEERICPICKIEMEDEYHFLNICPAYQEKRCSLLDYLEKEYRIKISRMSPNKIFMFLIKPPSGYAKTQKLIAIHVLECF